MSRHDIEPSDAAHFHRMDREDMRDAELEKECAMITRSLQREIEFIRSLRYPQARALLLLPEFCALWEQHGDEILERFVPLLAERAMEGE